ncbi:MAG: hydrogenase formation protein HypD [Candidatus Odinarchaeum yellowstonii]|uniref:Hydrogenase formation protein HypD n=1 Tax=Odinarchaeota yellowstonii (strain LCB_4) TaxID=1841599 RepID=A0AAF0D3P3_ODILC|nr:MAG: hydrogenase formation protein HypD [Candidatus Odinarchaeum yellowstonii]
MFKFKDPQLANRIIDELRKMNLNIRLMHACGTHQDTLIKSGLNSVFEKLGVEIRQGPGCPICVTPANEIEEAITLAEHGLTLTVFGDAMRVTGFSKSLYDARAEGCDVRIVYSIGDAVKIAEENPGKNVVFLAIGFETTAPATASTLIHGVPENFYILSSHRYFPPALDTLLSLGEIRLDGLIQPGHVSVITGLSPYYALLKKYNIPQVIAGFEPLDMLLAVYSLSKQIIACSPKVENEYTRAVTDEGNLLAKEYMTKVFEPYDVVWRGFPVIKSSGMRLRKAFKDKDARIVFADFLKDVDTQHYEEPKGCRCNEILRGLVDSFDCPLFGNKCTPEHPVGPCMVSVEGNCNINYRYTGGKKLKI